MLAKRFAGVHVGEVDLNNRKINSGQGIPNRNTCMRISRGIDDNAIGPIDIVPNKGDNFTFGVGLKDFEINALSCGDFD